MVKSLVLLLTVASVAHGQDGAGILGLGLHRYNPACATTCKTIASSAFLACTNVKGHKHLNQLGMNDNPTACLQNDEPYLTTSAFCIRERCAEYPVDKLETFWRTDVGRITGDFVLGQPPKWTYQETLAQINGTPTAIVVPKQPLDQTAIITDQLYNKYKITFDNDTYYENKASIYSVVVVATVIAVPLILWLANSILRAPPTALAAKIKSILVMPAVFGRRHRAPAWGGFGIQPTRGVAILLLYFLVINLLLSVVDYPTSAPNLRYKNNETQIKMGVGLRTGLLSFANMALVIFLAGRNTLLLWLTDWSRSTYLMIHRWVAYVAILQGAIHCLIYLQSYVMNDMYFFHAVMPFFIYGTVGMLGMVGLYAFSVLPIRHRWYEAFLIGHIIFSIITLVGCWYHVWYLYENLWGFEVWLYIAIGAWVFDRLFRIVKMAKWGVKQATITNIDDDYMQIDIPGVATEGHAFLYFPTLSWKVWENHPFSIASSIRSPARASNESGRETPTSEYSKSQDLEKFPVSKTVAVASVVSDTPTRHLTFVVRKVKGTTAKLAQRGGTTIPVMIEGGYGKSHDLQLYPKIVAIAGGTGITTILPTLRQHPGRAKLYWGVRNDRLVKHLRANGFLAGIEVAQVSVGERLDLAAILDSEIDGYVKEPIVMVSGPSSMADDVRAATVNVMRRTGMNVKLLDESFSW